jgi:hypothetical protein
MDLRVPDINRLAEMRVHIVAPHNSQLWNGGNWNGRVYHRTTKNTSLLPKNTAIYIPKHGADWEGHPGLYATLEVLVYTGRRGRWGVDNIRTNTPFFLVPSGWLPGLLDGSVTERDILVELEKNQE